MTSRTLSPFQAAAPALRRHGLSVIPLAPNSKYPTIEGWSEYCYRSPTDDEHGRWMNWRASNVGVCLGPSSGIMALDFDDDVDGLHAGILAVVPDSPVKKRGAKGFTAFYRYNGQRSQGFSVQGQRVLDILSEGRQTVLPPSLHPAGGAYQWVTSLTLADVTPEQLPEIPPAAMGVIRGLFRPEPVHVPRPAYHEPYRSADHDDIDGALRCIPADDYDIWLRIGMALKDHLGDKGMAVWDAWSSSSPKYNAAEIPKRWNSFRRQGVGIGTLFYHAMDHGYIPPRHAERVQDRPAVVIEEGGNLRPANPTPPPAAPSVPAAGIGETRDGAASPDPSPGEDILNPPGLVGRIARWINLTSIYPQPMLAVAAAITATGAAMAHKVQSPTRLRTNFYTMGLAPSGAGKDHARDCVATLLCRSGLESVIGGTPASGAGMLTALREGGGRCLILWDEFGRVLRNLNHKNAGSHQRDILTYLIELFSSAKSMYAGVQYANHDGKMKRTPIDQPCLSVYATTVPERFFQTLTNDDAIDGFLARWLVLESKDYTLRPARVTADVNDPPEDLLAELRRWKDAPSNYDPRGNIDGVLRICPMVVSYTDEAEEAIAAFSEEMRRKSASESARRTGFSAIYARSAEHAIKLALAAHEGETIGVEAMRWGIAMARHCAAYMAEAVRENVVANEFERASKKILSIIADGRGDWVGHSLVVRRTQELGVKIRHELISNLAEAGMIEVRDVKSEGRGRPANEYRALGGAD
ncbi:MAG: PriCT-2 domain-containing protein [Isosphaeraceae bacterium]